MFFAQSNPIDHPRPFRQIFLLEFALVDLGCLEYGNMERNVSVVEIRTTKQSNLI